MISYPRMPTWEWVWEIVQRYKQINNITKWIEVSDEFPKFVIWYELNLPLAQIRIKEKKQVFIGAGEKHDTQ